MMVYSILHHDAFTTVVHGTTNQTTDSRMLLLQWRDDLPRLRDYPRERRALEAHTSVPLDAQRSIEAALELRAARVREGEVLHRVLRRLLIPLLRDDDVRLSVVCARRRVDARNAFDEVRLGRGLARALPAPCAPAGQGGVNLLWRVFLQFAPLRLGKFLVDGLAEGEQHE